MQSIIKKVNVQEVAPGTGQRSGARASSGSQRRSGGNGRACEQGVRLLREAERVHAIEITCSCGEVTLVELEYPAASESNQ